MENEHHQEEISVAPQSPGTLKPVVFKTKKKKKYKYSRGLKDLQRSSRGVAKVSSRLARSVVKGMDAYRKASDKSARKKRDGAIRDIAKGLSKSLRASSRVPYDLARVMDQRGTRRTARRQVRTASRLARLLRIR